MALADALQIGCGVGMALAGFLSAVTLGWRPLLEHPLILSYLQDPARGDSVRALLLAFCAVYYLLFLPLRRAPARLPSPHPPG